MYLGTWTLTKNIHVPTNNCFSPTRTQLTEHPYSNQPLGNKVGDPTFAIYFSLFFAPSCFCFCFYIFASVLMPRFNNVELIEIEVYT